MVEASATLGTTACPSSIRAWSSTGVSSGSATASCTPSSPSRSGSSRACLAKLMGTRLTRSPSTSSEKMRATYGRSSCAASAFATSSSEAYFSWTSTSPMRPPLSACTRSASSSFSWPRPAVRQRISPSGLPHSRSGAAATTWVRSASAGADGATSARGGSGGGRGEAASLLMGRPARPRRGVARARGRPRPAHAPWPPRPARHRRPVPRRRPRAPPGTAGRCPVAG